MDVYMDVWYQNPGTLISRQDDTCKIMQGRAIFQATFVFLPEVASITMQTRLYFRKILSSLHRWGDTSSVATCGGVDCCMLSGEPCRDPSCGRCRSWIGACGLVDGPPHRICDGTGLGQGVVGRPAGDHHALPLSASRTIFASDICQLARWEAGPKGEPKGWIMMKANHGPRHGAALMPVEM